MHDNKHVAILVNFVLDCELQPVAELNCDKCIKFVDYITTVDDYGNLMRKSKEELDEDTFQLLLYGQMEN